MNRRTNSNLNSNQISPVKDIGSQNYNIQSQRNKVGSPKKINDDCCICLSQITDNKGILECKHAFCIQCILRWSEKENTCPLCKKIFKQIKELNDKGKLCKIITVASKKQRPDDNDAFEQLLEEEMLIQDEEYQDDGFVVEDVESIIHLSIQEIMFAQAAERSLSDQRSQGFTRLNVVNAMIGAVEDRMNNHLAIGRYTRIQNNNQRGRGRGRGRGILRSNG